MNDLRVFPEQQPVPQEMMQLEARLPTGRTVAIAVPTDITTIEALSMTSWVAGILTQKIAERPTSRILVPTGVVRP
jgi:hypothetical protein